jgi:hypothetical protein
VPAAVIQQALDAWREGERLLEELAPLSADHEAVGLQLITLREAYGELTGKPGPSKETIAACAVNIDAARELIHAVRAKQRPIS